MPFTPLPTIREIAERCGAARSTVGHILGGRDHRFRPETRERVLRAAEELGWKRPEDWRGVKRARFGCAVLLRSTDGFRSVVSEAVLGGLEQHLLACNMHLTLARLPDELLVSEVGLRRLLKQWSADGLLISYTQAVPPRMTEMVERLRLPAVWLNNPRMPHAVRPDDHGAGRAAAELLLAAGHRRIAYLGFGVPPGFPPEHMHASTVDRPDGARAAVLAAGGAWSEVHDRSIAGWRARLGERERPTAIIAYSAGHVLQVLYAALTLGLRVPGDLSLVTFEEEPVYLLEHEITSFALPDAEVAEVAVRELRQRIAGEPAGAVAPLTFPLRQGRSVAPPPDERPRRRRVQG